MDKSSKELKKLQATWYKKLEKSGFKDLEKGAGSQDEPLKSSSSDRFNLYTNRHQHGGFEFKQEYFRIAGHFLYSHRFENPLEKEIWALHADGISIRKIVKILKAKRIAIYQTAVHEIIKKLASVLKGKYVKK